MQELLEPWHARARERLAPGRVRVAEVSAWRRAYAQSGVKPDQYRSAAEALLRASGREGDLPRLHPLIDLCNAVVARPRAPVAVLDLAGSIRIWKSATRWAARSTRLQRRDRARGAGRGDLRGRGQSRQRAPVDVPPESSVHCDSRHHEVLIVAEGLHATAGADVPASSTRSRGSLAAAGVRPATAPSSPRPRRDSSSRPEPTAARRPSVRSIVVLTLPAGLQGRVFGSLYGAAARGFLGVPLTLASSLLVYSGALQFAMVALLGAGATTLPILLTAGVLNLRHLVLGAALRSRFESGPLRRALLAFFLADETSGSRSRPAPPRSRGVARPRRPALLGLTLYVAFFAGTTAGCCGSGSRPWKAWACALSRLVIGLGAPAAPAAPTGRSPRPPSARVVAPLCRPALLAPVVLWCWWRCRRRPLSGWLIRLALNVRQQGGRGGAASTASPRFERSFRAPRPIFAIRLRHALSAAGRLLRPDLAPRRGACEPARPMLPC